MLLFLPTDSVEEAKKVISSGNIGGCLRLFGKDGQQTRRSGDPANLVFHIQEVSEVPNPEEV